ncbi:M24 family metallopeptidase [Aliiglaciecola sp. 3_MG-2023]|uniref:M24 family metallopeptidase n=1 Tax=Aliiglaciecola sp. 3_MG-2023 TaxID=3062644 RepID=UPI0026E3BA69|nr:M24 family metallopeptidase [Aliiglaciecola sp. 3_MG-2023]MDO6695420.1 M24 family metallopeptidase [Aliiglaciecola sp. 3_MG-2023]
MKLISVLFVLWLPFFAFAQFSDPSPWPEIRKQRIATLLPSALAKAEVDAWLVICRENNNDPLADHVGCENAGQTAVFLFYNHKNQFHSMAFSPAGESTALKDVNLLDEVVSVERNGSAIQTAANFIIEKNFANIAINMSTKNAQADGISFTQYQQLTKALGAKFTQRLTSAEEVIYQWLSIKLPAEIDIMRKAAVLTAQWQVEAYQQVIPGVTTDADVARFLKMKMREAGVTDGWAAAQNPNINSGSDRGHSHPTDKIIQPGDVIQTDFGIRVYDRWVTDIQRFAYVLKDGESAAPADIQRYWKNAKQGQNAAFTAMKPGVRGIDVDTAQRKVMEATGSIPLMWSTGHPVGYVAHDTGPNLGGSRAVSVRPASLRTLAEGMTFAFDGFYSWSLDDGQPKTISVEEMVQITKDGAEYLIPVQQELILIKSN